MKAIAASLNQQTIDNLAAYYASLRPEQPASAKNTPRKPAPVLLENRVVSGLDQATIADIATYYASQRPAQPDTAKYPAPRYVPALVRAAAPVDGLSPGGIISFRADDPGTTAEQTTRSVSAATSAARESYWTGSTHETRRRRVHRLPHSHEGRVAEEPIENGVPAGHLFPVPQGPSRPNVSLVAHADARRQGGLHGLS